MATIWAAFLEIFQVGLFGLTQFYGGHLAAAIISFSLLARLALLPITIRQTLRARAHAKRVRALQPEITRVRERWQADPQRQATETMAVYKRHSLSPVDAGLLKGTFLQMPVFLGLFHGVRTALNSRAAEQTFLWVSNLARPDFGIAVLAFLLVGLGSAAGATQPRSNLVVAIPALSAFAMAMFMSAGFGLYLASTGLIGTLQGLIIRRVEAKGR